MPPPLWSTDTSMKIVLDGLESSTLTLLRLLNLVLGSLRPPLFPGFEEAFELANPGWMPHFA
jgi:hypothetical protein